MKTRLRGTCPICFNVQVVKGTKNNERLVVHGYNRPNTGWIINDCPGTHQTCFERSPEATRRYVLNNLQPYLEAREEWLAKVSSPDFRGTLITEKRERTKDATGFSVWKSVVVEVPWDENRYGEYQRLRESEIRRTSYQIKATKEAIADLNAKIEAWVAKEPVEELAAPPKPPTVHKKAQFHGALCRSRWGYGTHATNNDAEVTCTRCLKKMGGAK